jgi:hypothetical protein
MDRGVTFLFQTSQFAMGVGVVVGGILTLAGMADPGPGESVAGLTQLLKPLSGPVVIGAMLVGLRTIRDAASASRPEGAKLIGVAMVVIAIAVLIALAAPPTRGLAIVLAITGMPTFMAGCALIQVPPNDAR